MENPKYQIFEQDRSKTAIPYNLVMIIVWVFAIILFFVSEQLFSENEFLNSLKNTYLFCSVLLSIYLMIAGLWSYQYLNGNLIGFIEFRIDSFEINGEMVKLEDVSRIDIHAEDYYGQQTRGIGIDFSPGLFQGVNNFIEFTQANKITRKIYFKQTIKNQYKDFSSFIIVGIQKNKIPFLRGIELLEISEYDEIKEFKRTVASGCI